MVLFGGCLITIKLIDILVVSNECEISIFAIKQAKTAGNRMPKKQFVLLG